MKLKDIYITISRMVRKDSTGGIFTIDDFNRYVQLHSLSRFYHNVSLLERDDTVNSRMERYMREEIKSSVSEVEAIPDSFEKHLMMRVLVGANRRPVDLITRKEFEGLTHLTRPTTKNPVVYYSEGNYHVVPHGVNVQYHYLVKPSVPFLDYYYDANRNIVYFEAGASVYTLDTGEESRDGATSGTVTPITVEMDMHEEDQQAVMSMLLRQLGVKTMNDAAFQYGTQEQIRSER